MRRGAPLVAIAVLALACVAPGRAGTRAAPEVQLAQAASQWERLRDSARSWLGLAEDPAAALARLGGARVLLRPDVDDYRATMLPELRDDVRRLLREARIPHGFLDVRDGSVEVRLRDPSHLPPAMTALAATAGPARDAVDIRDAGDGAIRLAPTEHAITDRLNGSLDQTIDIIRRRLEGLDLRSVAVQRVGPDRILVIAPGLGDSRNMVQLIARQARLDFRLVDLAMATSDAMRTGLPQDAEVLPVEKTQASYLVRKESRVGGRDIVQASAAFDANGRPCVDFRFTARGAREFGRLTQENVGRQLAIVLDNVVLSAPVIQTPILGGTGQITGNFTVEEASRLAVLLRVGMLPVRLIVVEQTIVAPPPKN
jgi:preprotein translocase subunit SecD